MNDNLPEVNIFLDMPNVMPPKDCRQRLAIEGKAYPRSSCAVCGQFSPNWKDCDSKLVEESDLNKVAKQITAEDVRKLREETGEGMMACHKILLERAAQEEKAEMLSLVCDLTLTDRKTERLVKQILTYLIRKA